MSLSKNILTSRTWFWMGMVSIFLISIALRFWGLGRFNTLVFDEVYYAIFANNYLTHTQFFDGHPPLSKYIIAIGIWLGNQIPFGKDTINGLTGSQLSTFSYRWLNALTGSFIPLVVGAIAYQLNHRRSYALIAALFAAADGLFLVESRYALNNVYLVIFGLLGQLCFLLALTTSAKQQRIWLAIAGIWFGATISIKWNGLWFLLGIYLLWIGAWVMQWIRQAIFKDEAKRQLQTTASLPLQNLTQLNFLHIVFNLGIIPVAVYSLCWIPHLQLNPKPGFWDVQKEILSYHQKVGGNDIHPYCSPWYTWPLMSRPVAYFYDTARNTTEQVPAFPPLPVSTGKVIYDVHAIGNPILWWLSTAAMLLLILLLVQRLLTGKDFFKTVPTPSTWVVIYLVVNYAANWLPWVRVTRCTFLYHYMGSAVFAGLALAWIVDRWIQHEQQGFRKLGYGTICAVLFAFIFWMPIYLGLPLPAGFYQLWVANISFKWLPSWINWINQLLPHWI